MTVDKLVGIIGWPVSHSISPAMHNRAFCELGLENWFYVPLPVSCDAHLRVKEAVLGLRALGFQGANVTVPHKEAVLPFLDILSDRAQAIQAVNTIVIDAEGRLVGHNTDGEGFIADLVEHEIAVHNKSALILGAGGSARAITYALLSNGCKDIIIVNRTTTKADDIAQSYQQLFPDARIVTGPLEKNHLKQIPQADLVINTTSIGMTVTKDQMPWYDDIELVPGQIIYDLIYNPQRTLFLHYATCRGAVAINGLGMLVHQGALALEIWTGKKAPVQVMYQAALAELNQWRAS